MQIQMRILHCAAEQHGIVQIDRCRVCRPLTYYRNDLAGTIDTLRDANHTKLLDFIDQHPKLLVLTGAGISVAAGIPEYRDENGDWKRPAPVQYGDFLRRHSTRQRYWARSLVGWPWFQQATPAAGHVALAAWERQGRILHLVTQNVDRLHQAAGSVDVTDLHGRLDRVACLDCTAMFDRNSIQAELRGRNPDFAPAQAAMAPDGDAYLDDRDCAGFVVPDCPHCGGILKPDVVFFGETIPAERVSSTLDALANADALLVIGSSLMVYSGYRFCLRAAANGQPIAAVNPGRTRADDLLQLKIGAPFESLLEADLSLATPGDRHRSSG
jgi:NAD-dependent SIR2 family protein deacetylase